ncbi:unnamed protein product [Eruca vesicaria subsp. sativa]|uniref:Uncharacterized protein n=1 Tax=Eruca vesicaria subsp. sativa TaxID=29727 RepID=A0ABC8IMZ6_ERUVS|nr:unnamed protein product [Eruca vesicaria subsp. sativa]
MGQDYSYSQPSSSGEEYDFGYGCLLQGEADGCPDEAESSYNFEMSQKVLKVEKTISDMAKKQSVVTNGLVLGVCVLGTLLVCLGLVVSAQAWFDGGSNTSL